MLNHEGSHPEYFEELCALAASGQVSEAEFIELQEHLQQCETCQSTYSDYVDLLHNKLPLADPEVVGSSKVPGFFSESPSYRDRFLARARKEGLAVPQGPLPDGFWDKLKTWSWAGLRTPQFATATAVALLITLVVVAYSFRESNIRYRRLAAELAEMSKQLSRQDTSENVVPRESQPSTLPQPNTDTATRAPVSEPATEAELTEVRTDRAAAEERSKLLEDRLAKVVSELEDLRTQNEETNVSREQLEKKLKEAEQVANAVKDDLREIRQSRSKDSLTIATQDLEIQKLSEKLTAQTELLEQERTLLEASRDVRDLMGARTFHIADVYDVDSKGKDQRAFGRVFYTEGKYALIFYAFDLNDRNTAKRNASFQVWGKRGPAQGPTHSLGLFQIDDQKQNRWVLHFEDPRILAQIDSVFVTVEPPGGSDKPTGRQFLFAYLNATPSRP
jgi:hypothetical protein